MRDVVSEANDPREDEVQHAEQQQRPKQRPEIAEHRAEIAELEFRDRKGTSDVEETTPLGDVLTGRSSWNGELWHHSLSRLLEWLERKVQRALVRKVDHA